MDKHDLHLTDQEMDRDYLKRRDAVVLSIAFLANPRIGVANLDDTYKMVYGFLAEDA